jgi:hypothetical protein
MITIEQRNNLVLAMRTIKLDINPAQMLFVYNIIKSMETMDFNTTLDTLNTVLEDTTKVLEAELVELNKDNKDDNNE